MEGLTWAMFSTLTLGVLNALRPSIFMMIVFLLSMVALVDENRVLKVGLAFTAGVAATYAVVSVTLAGLSLRYPPIKYFVVVFGLIVGTYKILSALKNVSFPLPNPLREKTSRVLEKATTAPAAFVIGAIMAVLTIPCVLPSFLMTAPAFMGLTQNQARALLAVFIGLTVSPLLIVTLGFHYGAEHMRLGRAVDTLSSMTGRGDLALGVILILMSVVYWAVLI